MDPQQVHDKDTREDGDYSVWSDTTLEQALEESIPEEQPHADERQIELDTDRSFVLYPVGEHPPPVPRGLPLTRVAEQRA